MNHGEELLDSLDGIHKGEMERLAMKVFREIGSVLAWDLDKYAEEFSQS